MRTKILLGLIMFLFLNNHLFAQQQEAPREAEKPKPSLGLNIQPGGS